MSHNAADISKVREARQRERDAAKLADSDLKWMLSEPAGRRFLWKLMSDCGVFKSSFHPSSQIYFNEGVRSVGLNILSDLTRLAPEAFPQMMLENRGQDDNS